MHKLIYLILIVFDMGILFAAAAEITQKTTTVHPLLKTTTTPKVWGLYSYEVIFSNATALKGNQFIQIFRAFKRLHILKMTQINDGTDFTNYIDKEKWSKYKGQLIKFSPYEEENFDAIGQVNGSFIGAIYAKNDPIYFEEVPKRVRNAPGWRNATAIVYNNSQQKLNRDLYERWPPPGIQMDTDILLDVFHFLMREQIERFEIVCFHWHTLIAFISSKNSKWPLRPVPFLNIVLQGNNESFVHITQFTTQYKGLIDNFYAWAPKDMEKRYDEKGSLCGARISLIFTGSGAPVKDDDNGLAPDLMNSNGNDGRRNVLFSASSPAAENAINLKCEFRHLNSLWNNCSVQLMHLHICDAAIYSALIKNSNDYGIINDGNIISEFEFKTGMAGQNTKIDLICLHITTNCLYNDCLPNKGCCGERNKKNSFKNWLRKYFVRGTNNIFKKHSTAAAQNSSPSSSSFMQNEDQFIKIDSINNDAKKIYEFVQYFVMSEKPNVFCLYAPLPNEDLIGSVVPFFPKICCHIDVQGNDRICEKFIKLNDRQRAMLMGMIFSGAAAENSADGIDEQQISYKNKNHLEGSQPPQFRRIWKAVHNDNAECGTGGCYEFAHTSLTIHPIRLDAEFIDQIIEHFCTLTSTSHLVGRRIHFSRKTRINSECTECFDDHFDNELHTAWRAKCDNAKRRQRYDCPPCHGEYLIRNEQTGLEMRIQFGSHLANKCLKYHKENAKSSSKIYPKFRCPYENLFVLELSSATH